MLCDPLLLKGCGQALEEQLGPAMPGACHALEQPQIGCGTVGICCCHIHSDQSWM